MSSNDDSDNSDLENDIIVGKCDASDMSEESDWCLSLWWNMSKQEEDAEYQCHPDLETIFNNLNLSVQHFMDVCSIPPYQ